nr:SymE family type I addiction module toxin [Proteus sp. G2674]
MPNRGKPNPSPQLIISGKWLKELGFEVGKEIPVWDWDLLHN